MNDSEPYEIELTADLLNYAERTAVKEAKRNCPDFVDYDDIKQEVVLKLLSKPPKYDPTMGAEVKTLIYTIVQRIVLKHLGRERRDAGRFKQEVKPKTGDDDDREAALDAFAITEQVAHRKAKLTIEEAEDEDIFDFIDDKGSRDLCRLMIDCEGNMSEAARRMGLSEGTIRHRLKILAPKLLARGFDPFNLEEG